MNLCGRRADDHSGLAEGRFASCSGGQHLLQWRMVGLLQVPLMGLILIPPRRYSNRSVTIQIVMLSAV